MNKILLNLALPILTEIIGNLLTPENIRTYGDRLFDLIEDAVASSKTTIDDVTVLPVIKALRAGLGIPDNDDSNPLDADDTI